jgi:spore coat polysaccharide biosynthesis protein SpsF
MIDHNIIDDMITNYIKIKDDSKCYGIKYANPNKSHNFPDGFNPEIFSFEILKEAWENVILESDKEHVVPYMRRKYGKLEYEVKLEKKYENLDLEILHLSLDTPKDYKLLSNIFDNVYKKNNDFTIYDVLEYLNNNSYLLD